MWRPGVEAANPNNQLGAQRHITLGATSRVLCGGPHNTGENPTYGILERAQETWMMVELGTRCATERAQVGNSSPKVARA